MQNTCLTVVWNPVGAPACKPEVCGSNLGGGNYFTLTFNFVAYFVDHKQKMEKTDYQTNYGDGQQGGYVQPGAPPPAYGQPGAPAYGQPGAPGYGQPGAPGYGQPGAPGYGQPGNCH